MPESGRGLYLRLRVEKGAVAIEAAAPTPRWPRALLHAPLLTPGTFRRIASPGTETVLELLEGKGRVIASFGFAESPRVFFDRKAPSRRGAGGRRGALTGDTVNLRQGFREIWVPFPLIARFLNFYRSELSFVDGDRSNPRLDQEHVVIYSTAAPGEKPLPVPPLRVSPTRRVRALPLPWLSARRGGQPR